MLAGTRSPRRTSAKGKERAHTTPSFSRRHFRISVCYVRELWCACQIGSPPARHFVRFFRASAPPPACSASTPAPSTRATRRSSDRRSASASRESGPPLEAGKNEPPAECRVSNVSRRRTATVCAYRDG